MRIGRNFTNMLETSYISDQQKEDLKSGSLKVADMDATVQGKSKADIAGQVDVISEIGFNHIELDGGVPNPFLAMPDEEIEKAKKHAEEKAVSVSLHLPYTFVAESVATFQEEDRLLAVSLMKRYIDFAEKIGAVAVNMHPGSVPFYQAEGKYLEIVLDSLRRSIADLAKHCAEKGIILHVENNTAFDVIGVENGEMLEIVNSVRKEGFDVKYCFDIGHWFTRGLPQFGSREIPSPPESIVEEIPGELLYEVHLNDFVIKGREFKFHPPLHRQQGFLKKENLKNLAGIFRKKGVEIVVVETAVRDIDDLLNSRRVLAEESKYLEEIFS
ncbi:MAG: sugar phosphate isomerase/epimerase [Elusimicrobia bacterium]|nr:sugar phosphate isomerase/epimerase [Elusimicrobiota bacterium]